MMFDDQTSEKFFNLPEASKKSDVQRRSRVGKKWLQWMESDLNDGQIFMGMVFFKQSYCCDYLNWTIVDIVFWCYGHNLELEQGAVVFVEFS